MCFPVFCTWHLGGAVLSWEWALSKKRARYRELPFSVMAAAPQQCSSVDDGVVWIIYLFIGWVGCGWIVYFFFFVSWVWVVPGLDCSVFCVRDRCPAIWQRSASLFGEKLVQHGEIYRGSLSVLRISRHNAPPTHPLYKSSIPLFSALTFPGRLRNQMYSYSHMHLKYCGLSRPRFTRVTLLTVISINLVKSSRKLPAEIEIHSFLYSRTRLFLTFILRGFCRGECYPICTHLSRFNLEIRLQNGVFQKPRLMAFGRGFQGACHPRRAIGRTWNYQGSGSANGGSSRNSGRRGAGKRPCHFSQRECWSSAKCLVAGCC